MRRPVSILLGAAALLLAAHTEAPALDGKAQEAADYFAAIDAVNADPAMGFLKPIEARYVMSARPARVDVVRMHVENEASIVTETVARDVPLRRLGFSGASCWSARYYIEATPLQLSVIRDIRNDPDAVVRAVAADGQGPFPELARTCAGGTCYYPIPDAARRGPAIGDSERADAYAEACIDPRLLDIYRGTQAGIPAVLSTSTPVPCDERRGAVTDELCQNDNDLESYSLAWHTWRPATSAPAAPLHCDHLAEQSGGVCDALDVEPDEKLGEVRDLSVDRRGRISRLTGTIHFKTAGIADRVYELISEGSYSGCGSIGIEFDRRRNVTVTNYEGTRTAQVTGMTVTEFSLVHDGQDDQAGILQLERRVSGPYRNPAEIRAAQAASDPFTVGLIRRGNADTSYCKSGLLTDPRRGGHN